MASKKITAMPNLAGAQVPTDLTTLVDLSVAPALQNVKSTLNDLFAEITKNITDIAVQFGDGAGVATLSAASKGRLRYNATAQSFQASENAGAYTNLVKGSGSTNQIPYFSAGSTLAGIVGSAVNGAGDVSLLRADFSGNLVSATVDKLVDIGTDTLLTSVAKSQIGLNVQTYYAPTANTVKGVTGISVFSGIDTTNTSNSAGATGIIAGAGIDGAGNHTNVYGLNYSVYHSGAGTVTLQAGSVSYVGQFGAGTTTDGVAYLSDGSSIFAGTMTRFHGFWAKNLANFGGTLGTAYGLRIEAQTAGATNYNLYSEGATANNQIEGYLTIGGTATAGEIRFLEPSGSGANYTAFKAQAQGANITYTLPSAAGSNGQALITNGSAVLSWSTLLSVAGVTGSVQINNGGGLLDGDGQFVYDPLTATVTIGSAALTGKLRLQAVTSGNGITIQTDAPAGNHTYVWPNALPTTTGQALTATGISGSTITLGWQASGGTTINSTDEFLPYRLNSTTFADSPIRRTGTQTVFITDGVTNFVSLGTGGVQTYQDGSSTFPIINLNSAGGLYVTSTHPAIARAGSSHTVFTAGQTLSVQDGTVSAPSWSFNADANTGIYRSAADTLNIAVGGVNPLEVGTVYVSLISGATATELRLYEPSGSGTNYTAFKAQAQTANVTYTLPAADGSSGQALTTNGSSTLSWAAPTPGTFADGTAAAPSITFTADTNTGFYRLIAENISATTAGTGIASFTTDGMTVGFVDQFSFATLYVSGKNSSYPAAIIRSVDTPTQNILEVTRKVGVNDYDVLTVKPFGDLYLTARPRTGTATPFLQVITPEDATLTASTQSIGLQLGGNSSQATVTRQWATGALALQQEIVVVAPTYAFAGASTVALAATFSITGAPKAGTNATLTKTVAAYFGSGAAAAVALLVEGSGTPSANIFEARLTSGASVFLAATQRETLYLAPIATVSSPTNGDVWSDSSRNTLASRIAGQNLFFSSCIFRAIDDKTVSNTTTETTLLAASVVGTATIAANHFQPGKVVKLRARGYWNTDAGNSSFNIRFKIGGVTVATGAINATASMTTLPWDVEIEATCRTTGVTGTVMIAGSFNNIQDGSTRAAYKWDLNAGAAGTIDTTGALTVDLTAQMGTATADNFIVCTSLVIELVG